AAAERDRGVAERLTALLKKENFDVADLVKGLDDFLATKTAAADKLKEAEARLGQIQTQLTAAGPKGTAPARGIGELVEGNKKAKEANNLLGKELKKGQAKQEEAAKAEKMLANARAEVEARLRGINEELKRAKISNADPAAGIAQLVQDRSMLERTLEEIA